VATATDAVRLLVVLLAASSSDASAPRGVRGRLGSFAGSVSNRVLDEVDPDAFVQRVDVDALLARVDVDALVGRVDVDRLAAGVDVDALLARVDVDALLARVDVDALLARVDVDALLARVDVNALLDRVDVNALLDRVDVDRLVQRADVDALVAQADVDAVADRIDVQRLVDRVDVDELVRRAGVPELIADSTGQVAGSALDLARRQLVGIDVGLHRIVQRLLRRDLDTVPAGPPTLVADHRSQLQAPEPDEARVRARMEVTGYYAGPVSRVLAFAGDIALATVSFTFGAGVLSWLLMTVLGIGLETTDRAGPWWALAVVMWFFLYWFVSSAIAGRTPVMLVAGLTMVSRDGTPMRPSRALVRTLMLPISVMLFVVAAVLLVVDRERRSLHDLVAGSAVVFDWGGRPAELPTPISRWIAGHGG